MNLSEGIQVWGAKQETLEAQALKELNIFSDENNQYKGKLQNVELEEGEIIETTISKNPDKLPEPSLNLEAYIKAQEALKKRQIFKKTLTCTSASKEIANRITKKLERSLNKRKKTVLGKNHKWTDSVQSGEITKINNNVLQEVEQEDSGEVQIAPKRRKKTNNENHSGSKELAISLLVDENEEVDSDGEYDNNQEDSGSEYVPSENELGIGFIFI